MCAFKIRSTTRSGLSRTLPTEAPDIDAAMRSIRDVYQIDAKVDRDDPILIVEIVDEDGNTVGKYDIATLMVEKHDADKGAN